MSEPIGFAEGRVPARLAAQRSVLKGVQNFQSGARPELGQDPQFPVKSEVDDSTGLLPRIDAGLDSAHRFALLGAVFRPMRQFLRRTFDGTDEDDLSSDLYCDDSTD